MTIKEKHEFIHKKIDFYSPMKPWLNDLDSTGKLCDLYVKCGRNLNRFAYYNSEKILLISLLYKILKKDDIKR